MAQESLPIQHSEGRMAQPHSSSHILALDGVRGIALLIVMLAHTSPQIFPGGNIGVDLFFSLSGFLITSILLNEHAKSGKISIRNFYVRRALRLFPALAGVVVAVVAYALVFAPDQVAMTLSNAGLVALYVWNWVLAFNILDPQWSHNTMFSHLWSLSVEEQFYIIWPFVLILSLSPKAPKWLFGTVLAAGIVGPALARMAIWKSGPSLDLYFRTDLRFDNLMWGAAGAWLITSNGDLLRTAGFKLAAATAGTIGLVLFPVLARFDLLSNGVLYLGGYSLIGALAVSLIVAAAIGAWSPLRKVLEFRPLTFTGEISYGLYLWHVPAFHIAANLPIGTMERNMAGFAGTYVVATLSYFLMEKPIRQHGREVLARRSVMRLEQTVQPT